MNSKDFHTHLYNDLLPFWMKMRDDTNGGFYGFADSNGTPDPQSSKGVILQSRILWFFSSAYLLHNRSDILDYADHAYRFLSKCCYDDTCGGMYWSVEADGTPCEDMKHTYCQAFAIYALSAYYRASGSQAALELARSLYRTIEHQCRDNDGYLEAFARDFSLTGNDKLSENGVMADRTMNTLLHVLECYTELLKAEPSPEVAGSINKILNTFKRRIYNPDLKRCEVFFDINYNSIIDLESYGHDIEASWLIHRACEVLGDDEVTSAMMPVITGLAQGALEHAMDDKTNAMNNECENGKVDHKKVWWVQAEAVTGFYNAYTLTGDPEYLKASEQIWDYIRNTVIDSKHGEWIENIYDGEDAEEKQPLVHTWKCPYHNGRMCIEMMLRQQGAVTSFLQIPPNVTRTGSADNPSGYSSFRPRSIPQM